MKKHKTNCIVCWKPIEASFKPSVEEILCLEVICCNNKHQRHKQVLVVDDEQGILNIIERIYKYESDYEINTTLNPDTALGFIKTSRIDLLITDLIMPDTDGINLIRAAREIRPLIKVILMTSINLTKLQNNLDELEINAYLEKPFEVKELKTVIQKVLNQKI